MCPLTVSIGAPDLVCVLAADNHTATDGRVHAVKRQCFNRLDRAERRQGDDVGQPLVVVLARAVSSRDNRRTGRAGSAKQERSRGLGVRPKPYLCPTI